MRDQSTAAALAQVRHRYNSGACAATALSARAPPERTGANMKLSRETMLDDFSAMLTEAEELLRRAGNETGERAKDLRAQVEAKLLAAKLRLQELEGEAMDRARAAATLTDDYVHENPWVAIGAAAATGFLIGLLVTRR
jgi:ElaB/YqjD/DUF883 family membrane-anchored ribosome-binding protein